MSQEQKPSTPNLRAWPEHMRDFERARLKEVQKAIIEQVETGEPLYNELIAEYHFLREQVIMPIPELPPMEPTKLENGTWTLIKPAKK
jgi:hypothetical protein